MNMNTDIIDRAANFDPEGATAEDIASVALSLAARLNAAHKTLEGLKAALRTVAAGMRGTESHVQFQTGSGRVSVTFPAPRYKAIKGVDWDCMKADLGEKFDMYFTTKVSYGVRKDIEQVVKTRTAAVEITEVMKALSRDEPTPRVGFKPD